MFNKVPGQHEGQFEPDAPSPSSADDSYLTATSSHACSSYQERPPSHGLRLENKEDEDVLDAEWVNLINEKGLNDLAMEMLDETRRTDGQVSRRGAGRTLCSLGLAYSDCQSFGFRMTLKYKCNAYDAK